MLNSTLGSLGVDSLGRQEIITCLKSFWGAWYEAAVVAYREVGQGKPGFPSCCLLGATDAGAAGGRGADSCSADLSPGLSADKQAVPRHCSPAVLPAQAGSVTAEARQGKKPGETILLPLGFFSFFFLRFVR